MIPFFLYFMIIIFFFKNYLELQKNKLLFYFTIFLIIFPIYLIYPTPKEIIKMKYQISWFFNSPTKYYNNLELTQNNKLESLDISSIFNNSLDYLVDKDELKKEFPFFEDYLLMDIDFIKKINTFKTSDSILQKIKELDNIVDLFSVVSITQDISGVDISNKLKINMNNSSKYLLINKNTSKYKIFRELKDLGKLYDTSHYLVYHYILKDIEKNKIVLEFSVLNFNGYPKREFIVSSFKKYDNNKSLMKIVETISKL